MRKFFESGAAFFGVAVLFIIVSALSERPAVWISLGIVMFILGAAVRKKNPPGKPDQGNEQ